MYNGFISMVITHVPSINELTGSARITTCTVALPGVSKLTSGVKTVCSAAFIELSIPGSYEVNFTYELRVVHTLYKSFPMLSDTMELWNYRIKTVSVN